MHALAHTHPHYAYFFHVLLLCQGDQLVLCTIDQQGGAQQPLVIELIPIWPVLAVHCVLKDVRRYRERLPLVYNGASGGVECAPVTNKMMCGSDTQPIGG